MSNCGLLILNCKTYLKKEYGGLTVLSLEYINLGRLGHQRLILKSN